MSEPFSWVPAGINTDVPSAARVYDFLLGGGHNFASDRMVGDKVLQILREGRAIAASNRSFMRRAVLLMMEQGITQFLDLGSGIPTVGNVHEIVQQRNPDARVVYVDYDEVAVSHSQLILEGNDNAGVVQADMCRPDDVLSDPVVKDLIDFSRPVGLLMIAVLHFVSDDKGPAEVVARYRDAVPEGSLIALSHLTADFKPDEMGAVVEAMKHSRDPMYFRARTEFEPMFAGMEVLQPGVVPAPNWHPELGPAGEGGPEDVYVGIGRKL
ncbi:SAM-dependent methyltransferase [Lentzea flaviverrucosa]|uniref:S-adenosyl methyltransferase n=1 Tax=Lentzea flaviverrucosa TaxID=200379 RepID=A0A1H9RTC6_9PSEU|nr:SAM-dependent methyltransferase [Lentzea flaviverrucosa]RDI33131.1 S-adenosyl methyltransferase [Lentzea flaviverrucosa]SER75844.1 S-adenosyl methyltransferase [Lentzea flaviverrucosa]